MLSTWVRWIRTKSASSWKPTANAAYAAPGYLLFYRDKTLLAQPFDLKRFALTGEATTILPQVQFLPQVKRAVFAVSDRRPAGRSKRHRGRPFTACVVRP